MDLQRIGNGARSDGGDGGRMSGYFDAGRRFLVLMLVMMVFRLDTYAQVPCPVALVSAKAEKDSIRLEFWNKGKVPIEQLSLACLPTANNKFVNGICHVESGIFYPSTVAWIKIDYLGANRHPVEISVARLRLAGGRLWQPGSSGACKALRLGRRS
jgi:hypothetical protein